MTPEEGYDAGPRRIDQVVARAAAGATDRQIAEALGVSVHTVGTYWKRLRAHWGVSSRAAVVQAHLRHRVDQGQRALIAELGRRAEAEAKLQAAYDELKLLHDVTERGLTARLIELQRGAAASAQRERACTFYEEATHAARAVAYEAESVMPVVYRGLSPSGQALGIDVEATLRGRTTFYDLLHPEDLHALQLRMAGVKYQADVRYVYLYRLLTPEPRWTLDVQRAKFGPDGRFAGLVGLAVDVHDLTLAGLVEPRFGVVIVPENPVMESEP